MLIELPVAWIVTLNVVGWLLIQMGVAWLFTRMPSSWFSGALRCGPRASGRLYESALGIRRWIGWLPDGARLFKTGFRKRSLRGRNPEYLRRFAQETWRAELCHWTVIGCSPLFFVWNPPWGDAVIFAYAICANLPCIFVQQYNRLRLRRVLVRTA